MYETYTTVQGRLVADPVVKQGRYGAFTTFRVAQSERHQVREEPGRWADSEPSFFEVSVNRGPGENAARCLRKGHPVVVHGRLRIRQFQRDDGSYGTSAELDAYALGHDLRWGVTAFTRNGDVEPVLPAHDVSGAAAPDEAGGVAGGRDAASDPYVVEKDVNAA